MPPKKRAGTKSTARASAKAKSKVTTTQRVTVNLSAEPKPRRRRPTRKPQQHPPDQLPPPAPIRQISSGPAAIAGGTALRATTPSYANFLQIPSPFPQAPPVDFAAIMKASTDRQVDQMRDALRQERAELGTLLDAINTTAAATTDQIAQNQAMVADIQNALDMGGQALAAMTAMAAEQARPPRRPPVAPGAPGAPAVAPGIVNVEITPAEDPMMVFNPTAGADLTTPEPGTSYGAQLPTSFPTPRQLTYVTDDTAVQTESRPSFIRRVIGALTPSPQTQTSTNQGPLSFVDVSNLELFLELSERYVPRDLSETNQILQGSLQELRDKLIAAGLIRENLQRRSFAEIAGAVRKVLATNRGQ